MKEELWDYEAFVKRTRPRAIKLAEHMLCDKEDAEDVVQESYLVMHRVWDATKKMAHGRGPDAFFFTTLKHLCLAKLRTRSRKPTSPLDAPFVSDTGDTFEREIPDCDSSSDPQAVLAKQELWAHVLAAVEALPPDYKQVMQMREFQYMSYNEIVVATGLSLENVKTRLYRARGMLQRTLGPYLNG